MKLLSTFNLFFLFILNNAFGQLNIDSLGWTVKCVRLKDHHEMNFSGTADDLAHFHKIYKEQTGLDDKEIVYIRFSFNGTKAILEDTLSSGKAKHFLDNHSDVLSKCDDFMEYDIFHWITPTHLLESVPAASSGIDNKLNAPQGKGSFYIEYEQSKETENRFFISLQRTKLEYDTNFKKGIDLVDVFFFFYLYGTGDAYSIFQLSVTENDINGFNDVTINGYPSSNNKNSMGEHTTDSYFYNIPLDFKGWKMFANPYSDLKISLTTNSNFVKEPEKISTVRYGLLNKNIGAKARLNIDYLAIFYSTKKR